MAAIGLASLFAAGTLMAEPADAKKAQPAALAENGSEKSGEKTATDSATAIIGTWINKDYNGQGRSGRVVYSKDPKGKIRYVATDMADGSGAKYPGSVVFHKQWTDDKGVRHGQSTVTLDQGFAWKTLSRISADGKTLEVQSGVKKINPKGARYSIYHKEE